MQSISKEEGTTQMRVQHQTERTITDGVGREKEGKGEWSREEEERKEGRKAGRGG